MSTAELAFANARLSALDLLSRLAIRDDAGVPRCIVCLAAVSEERVSPEVEGCPELRIRMAPMVHGYECLSCGQGEPPKHDDGTDE